MNFAPARLLVLLGAAATVLPPAARAADFTWDGGGISDNWSDANNWLTNAAPPSSRDTGLILTGPTRLTPFQNIASPFVLSALTFDANAGAFTLGGSALNFQSNSGNALPTLTQSSGAAQTFNNAVALSNNLTVNVAGAGGLTLGGVVSGSGNLTKTGVNVLTLSGTNTFTGGLNVSAGRVVAFNNGNALAGGSVSIGLGATVELANTTGANISVAGGTTFAGAGTLVKSGSGTVSFGGNGGNVTVSLGAGALIDVQGGTLNGSSTNQGFFTNNLAGLNIAAGATFNGVEGTVQVDALTGAGTLRGGYQGTNTTTVGVNGGGGTFSGVIADNTAQGGALALTKVGTGTQALTGANTYSGTTTISGGALQIGNGGTTGTLGSGAVVDNAVLSFNRADAITVANVISGGGQVSRNSSGTLTLTGANTYSGGTRFAGGSLGAGNAAAFGTGTLTAIASGSGVNSLFAAGADRTLGNAISLSSLATLTVVADPAGAHNLTLNGAISGTGGLSVNAAGSTVTLGGTAANTFTGSTNVTAGTLLLNKSNGGTAVAGNLTIGNSGNPGAPGSVVVRQNSFNQLGNGSAGAVNIGPDGILDLNGNSAYVGALSLTAGAITIGPSGPLLRLTGDVTTSASGASSVIMGGGANAVILNGVRTFTVARGPGTYDLDVRSGTAFGTLVKAGEGVLRLAGAPDQTLAVTLNAGTLAVANDGALGPDGTFTLAGGTVVADGAGRAVSNPVNVTGNATVGASVDGTPRALTFTGAASLAANATLTVSSNAGTAFSGIVSGPGGIFKTGSGTLTLGNAANTFTGGLTLNGGTLAVAGDGSLGGVGNAITLNAGTLTFSASTTTGRTYNLAAGTIAPASGTTLTYAGATLNGGALGAGNQVLAGGTTLNGARTTTGAVLSQSGGTVGWNNVTLGGNSTFTQAAGATLNSGGEFITTPNSTVTLNGVFNTTGGSVSGAVAINNGGQINQSGAAPLYLDGSRGTTVNAGGRLAVGAGSTVELGGLLVNNGTQTGVLNVNLGGLAKGTGSFGTVNVGDGGKFSPGNSPGTARVAEFTLGAGSRYDFETSDTASDFLSVTDMLTLSAGTTDGSRFVVGLFTLDASNNPAMLTSFDASQPRTFLLATVGGGIVGFDPAEASVDRTGFLNNTQGGTFTVRQQGNNLVVQFTPVPEPGTWALLLAGGALAGAGLRRRRRA